MSGETITPQEYPSENKMYKFSKAPAYGIPDPDDYGDMSDLKENALVDYFVQKHKAQRAGEHYDIRFGPDKLYSWATRKEMPESGKGITLFQSPLHSHGYGYFQGEIGEGYGKGSVKRHDIGKILLTRVSPGKLSFSIAHRKHPERFALIQNKQKPREWFLLNTTPSVPIEYKKTHYTKVTPAEAIQYMKPGVYASPKIDGAAAWLKLLKDKIEVISYRTSAAGKPIMHTERVFHGIPRTQLPKELINQVFRGEIYGEQEGKVIPASQLGGLLNSTLENSLTSQKNNKIKLKIALLDIWKSPLPFSERIKVLQNAVKHLPKNMHTMKYETDPEKMKALLDQVKNKQHPLTEEGIVLTTEQGKHTKVKFREPYRVWIREIYPSKGEGAGGFAYSATPDGPILGKVGTGFNAATRIDMLANPQDYIGRMALIKARGQFDSGAYREPSFDHMHEDY
jgi:hypothetical protein